MSSTPHSIDVSENRAIPVAGLRRILTVLLIPVATGSSFANAPKTIPDACDWEWDRIKSIGPINKVDLERALAQPDKIGGVALQSQEVVPLNTSNPAETQADLYYLLARVSFVVGAEQQPTTLQREEWFERAASFGHKSAKAALMRLRHRSDDVPIERRASFETYLQAAHEAAEAGDPEFASVLMDTAQASDQVLGHCRRRNLAPIPANSECKQSVVKPIETRRWAEVAARGGNPHAKNLLCTMHYFGTFARWGAEKDENLAFQWCFATHQTACSTRWRVGLLAEMYEEGRGVPKDARRAAELRALDPKPRNAQKHIYFPQISR